MTETKKYELTHDEVLEICQALKLHADALDHREGSRAETSAWARTLQYARRTVATWLTRDKQPTKDEMSGLERKC